MQPSRAAPPKSSAVRSKAALALHGVARVRMDAQLPDRLPTLTDWAGAPLPAGVVARVLETHRLLQAVREHTEVGQVGGEAQGRREVL